MESQYLVRCSFVVVVVLISYMFHGTVEDLLQVVAEELC